MHKRVDMALKLERRVILYTPDVWTRTDAIEVSNKHPELFIQIALILKKPFDRSEWKIETKITGEGSETWQCVCSKKELSVPYIVTHVPSGEKFLIGSSCISKFGNDELDKEVRAHKRANKCAGGNVILDLRTHEGKLGHCAEPVCRCRGPRCGHCGVLEEDCNCLRCPDCRWVTCRCPKCKVCSTKMGPNGECPCGPCVFCENYPIKCPCKTCRFCKKKMQICNCKKCIGCLVPIPDTEPWKTVCEWCWARSKTCIDCSRPVPESWKTRCFQCYKKHKSA
jgi:hypothetical protein